MTGVESEPLEGSYFVSNYPPFSCWAAEGAEAFRGRLARPAGDAAGPALGLYVHVPFCVERCQFCYYLSHDDRPGEMDAYVDALERELALYAREPALAGRSLDFVYFGGGTPSLLSTARIRRLLPQLQARFPWTRAREVTFECAPRSVTPAKLRLLRDCGVSRISLGVQQFDDDVLARNGRVHLVQDVERAYAAIREAEFEQVNLDLIVGLVGETDESFERSLEHAIALAPSSVTIYQLEIPLNTPLYRALDRGELASLPADWNVKRRRLARGFARLEQVGYTLRSAYTAARDGEHSDFVYQDELYRGADLLGIGVSSFSHLAGVNQQNLASLPRYLEAVQAGRLPLWRGYELDPAERLVREVVLQLKLGRVDLEPLRRKFDTEPRRTFDQPLARLERRGWLKTDADTVTLTREGLLRADRLLQQFYLPAHRDLRYS